MQKSETQEIESTTFYQDGIVKIFSLVGMSITGVMSVLAMINQNNLLATVLAAASCVYYFAFYTMKVKKNLKLSSSIVLYSLFILMFYLTFQGGVENTGPLWIYIVAPVSVFIHSLKKGLIDLLIFFVITCVILYLPQDIISHAAYSAEFKSRLILSFLTITFLSALYEYSRQKSYQDMLTLSKKYEQLARFDSLTKLSNRRDALNVLQYEKNKMLRSKAPTGIILCDIDYFKNINDQYGHSVGDTVLVELAIMLKNLLRRQDCISRWGGEEFLIILPDTNIQNSMLIAQKIKTALGKLNIIINDQKIQLTVSMGVSQFEYNMNIDEAINLADKHLYQAKDAGRNEIFPKI